MPTALIMCLNFDAVVFFLRLFNGLFMHGIDLVCKKNLVVEKINTHH